MIAGQHLHYNAAFFLLRSMVWTIAAMVAELFLSETEGSN